MRHKRPRGHSSCYPEETEPYRGLPDRASVPMAGGSKVTTCRPLPPLSIDREAWEEIGRRMGWTDIKTQSPSSALSAGRDLD